MPSMRQRQTSFAAGEFAPGLYGRTDFAKYGSGCRQALNFYVTPHGTLKNRAGTKLVDEVNSTLDPEIPGVTDEQRLTTRIVPFVFSEEDTLLLVFIPRFIKVYKDNGTTVELVTILRDSNVGATIRWTWDHIPTMQFNQVGDVLTIVAKGLPPYELKRLTADNTLWNLEEVVFENPDFPSYGGTPRIRENKRNVTGLNNNWELQTPDDESSAEWRWAVTRLIQRLDGSVVESKPHYVRSSIEWFTRRVTYHQGLLFGRSYEAGEYVLIETPLGQYDGFVYKCTSDTAVLPPVEGNANWDKIDLSSIDLDALYTEQTLPDKVVVTSENPAPLDWTVFGDGVVGGTDRIIGSRIYRGQSGLYGFVGEISANDDGSSDDYGFDGFYDYGTDPDFSKQPPSSENPFERIDSSGDKQYDTPVSIAHHEGRRWYGGLLDARPWTVKASAIEEYNNFDIVDISRDSNALSFDLSTPKYETVNAMIPRHDLIVLTDSSEWLVSGSGQSELVTPNSIAARKLSEYGASRRPFPLSFHDALLFVQSKGTVPRALMGTATRGNYQSVDISTVSRHLFEGKTLLDWAYAEDPGSLIWAVRSDGTLVSCTFVIGHELVAWTRHEIAGGTVQSVASIRQGTEDAVYLAVRRGNKVYLERMATRLISDPTDAIFLDGAVTYDGRDVDITVTITPTVAGEREPWNPCEVTITGEDTAGENDGRRIKITDDDGNVGLVELTGYVGPHYDGHFVDEMPEALDGEAISPADVLVDKIGDIDHITSQQEVYVNLDGSVAGPFNPESRQVPFGGEWAAVAHVGLPYNCDFESLDLAPEKGRQKIVKAVALETHGSRGGFVGQSLDEDDLEVVRVRQTVDDYDAPPLRTDETRITIPARWAYHGRIAFRQTLPMPISILGISREIEVGG